MALLCAGAARATFAAPAVEFTVKVHEILTARTTETALVDSGTFVARPGIESFSRLANFCLYVMIDELTTDSVLGHYSLVTYGGGTPVDVRSGTISAPVGLPTIIDGIDGKGKSQYRALLVPERVDRPARATPPPSDSLAWSVDPSAHFEIHFIPQSLGDFHWNGLRDLLEHEYERFGEDFALQQPGRINAWLCPGPPEGVAFDHRYGFAVDPARRAIYMLYNDSISAVDAQAHNLMRAYRWWGHAPDFLAHGIAGRFEFADHYVGQLLDEGTFVPLDSLMVTADFKRRPVYTAYFEASSFVRWFLGAYGRQKFRDLYTRSTDLSIRRALYSITGRTIAELERDWLDAVTARPIPPEEYYYHATRAMSHRRYGGQRQFLTLYLDALGDSLDVEAAHELANVHLRLGEYADAENWFGRVVAERPTAPMLRYYRANVRYIRGRLVAAQDDCDRALALDSSFSVVYLRAGDLAAARRDEATAQRMWERSLRDLESIPIRVEALLRLGRLHRAAGRYDTAAVLIEQAQRGAFLLLRNNPTAPLYMLRAGEALLEQGHADSARAFLESALYLEDRPFYIGRVLLALGRMNDLLADREEAVKFYDLIFDVPTAWHERRQARTYLNRIYRQPRGWTSAVNRP